MIDEKSRGPVAELRDGTLIDRTAGPPPDGSSSTTGAEIGLRFDGFA